MGVPKHLVNELFYRRFADARSRFVRSNKRELQRYALLLQNGDESEINSARSRLIASCFGGDDASVSIDCVNQIECYFLLREILEDANKKSVSFSIKQRFEKLFN